MRSGCVVNVRELAEQRRPRFATAPGIRAHLRSPGVATDLKQMGVHLRRIEPGFAGTNRHFHGVEEEWVYVLSGVGRLRLGPLTLDVVPGNFVGFPPGPSPHHFLNDGPGDLLLLEGGESRAAEDSWWYPDLRRMFRGGKPIEPYEEPPPEQGDAAQLIHVDTLPIQSMQHDVDPGARRRMRALHKPTGLTRQAVYWAEVKAGDRSTAFHTHDRTDEWIFILSGTAIADVGGHEFEVGADDFLGHAAGSAEHHMQAITDLTYLMGGMIDADDRVSYPRHGLRRVGGKLEPLNVPSGGRA